MTSEFDLIRRYFTRPTSHTDLAVGDDAALFSIPPGTQIVVTTDTLVAGTHFFHESLPRDLGWKTLAVNLSDLAAMGAAPRWATLALTLPGINENWISEFADGLFECAKCHNVDIVGGDTTRGPLAMTVTLFGKVPSGCAITRAGGRVEDDLWISGWPGMAALGLAHLQGRIRLTDPSHALAALHRPSPRVELGLALRDIAHAMIDVSDGLAGDLGHLCERSQLGAVLDDCELPLAALIETGVDESFARYCLFSGGDDYELLFAAPPSARERLSSISNSHRLPLTRIGQLIASDGLALCEADGSLHTLAARGYEHFTS